MHLSRVSCKHADAAPAGAAEKQSAHIAPHHIDGQAAAQGDACQEDGQPTEARHLGLGYQPVHVACFISADA